MKKLLALICAVTILCSNTVFALEGVTSTILQNYNKNSVNDNIFKISGNDLSFTLLGKENDKYYIAANDDYGIHAFSGGTSETFDPTNEKSIAYWLNNDFMSDDYTGQKLPGEILNYIDFEHVWQTEPAYGASEITAVCGIGLLSMTEFSQYINVLGIRDNMNPESKAADEYNFWWTRSPDSKSSGKALSIGFLGNVWSDSVSNKRLLRPAFYLNGDFFKNVKLNTAYMGSEIKKILNTVDLSAAGYTDEELNIIKDETNDFVNVEIVRDWSTGTYDKNYVLDKKISFSVNFENTSSRERTAYYYWQIGNTVSKKENIKIGGNMSESVKITLPVNTEGRYDIGIFVSFDSLSYTEYAYDVNYVKSISAKSSTKGYNTGLLTGSTVKEQTELLSASGIYTVRGSGFWNEIETSKGKYNWTKVDAHMKKASAMGLDVLYTLGLYNSRLYKTTDSDGKTVTMGSDEEIQAFVNYASAVAKRYPQITKYEVWNEPNANNFWPYEPNTDNYKKVIKAVSSALKAINPNIEIIVGVTSNSASNTPTTDGSYWCINWKEFISSLMNDEELLPYFDGVSIHTYYNNRSRADNNSDIADVTEIVRSGGGFKKIYMTETGGYSGDEWYNKNEDEKAREMVRQFIIGDEYQLDGTWIYEFVNSGTDITYSEDNYGVISSEEADFRPMEGYYAVKNYISQIDNAVYLGKTALGTGITAHVYASDDAAFMIAWSNTSDTVDYSFGYEVSAYDLYGKLIKKGSNVSIGESPVYVYGITDVSETAKEFIAEHIADLSNYSADSFNGAAENFKNCQTASDVYSIISEISKIGGEVIASGTLTDLKARALLYDISRVYNRIANYLSIMPDSVCADSEKVKKAYEAYELTLEDLSYSEGNGITNIYNSGLAELNGLSYDSDAVYCKAKNGTGYELDKYGNLKIYGNAMPGESVNMKITDNSGSLVYLNAETANAAGEYEFNYIFNGEFGTYNVFVKGNSISENTEVAFENYDNYVTFLQKKYYGMILKNEELLNLSKDYLFEYAELDAEKKILADVSWDLGSSEADVTFVLKNMGNESDVQVVLAGYNDNALTSVKSFDITLEQSDKTVFSRKISFDKTPDTLKAFLWEKESPYIPLIKVRTY